MIIYSIAFNITAFMGGKLFPILLEVIHLHGIMLLLAVNCCLGIVFVAFMRETKGESLDTMESKTSQK